MSITILGIESSCDDTSAAIIRDGVILSNIIAGQEVHRTYGGVVPELASRAHQQNIVPVVDSAIKNAGISKNEISGIAFTLGPGLLGSLLVGLSFAKGFALSAKIPMLAVNHIHGHILAHFIKETLNDDNHPKFPFLCLVVSGGHTQLVIVKDHLDFEVIGSTIDDAAGEAFDKCAKVIGLQYPGGPEIDKLAQMGDKLAFKFSRPRIKGLDFSFSGLKTSFLYSIRDQLKLNENFINDRKNDLCASLQFTIVEILAQRIKDAIQQTGIKEVALAGGVSANSLLRSTIKEMEERNILKAYIPEIKYTTDNAAMIAITGYYKYLKKEFSSHDISPVARLKM